MPRRGEDREPPRRQERDRREAYRDRPPRRGQPSRKAGKKPRRSLGAAVAIGLYKGLVVLSALIVAAYIGLQLASRAPEQKPPPVSGGQSGGVPAGDISADQSGQSGGPAPLERRDGVYTVLLAGTDAEGYRTDVMMVMCYDTVAQKVGVVSVPRDTITSRESGNVKLVYGPGGVEQRVEDIAQMIGVPIDYYILVNLQGFITLVDYLGGVELDIPLDMNYDDPVQNLHIHFTKGTHLVDGQGAMEAVRYRHDNQDSPNYQANQWYSDVQRTEMQQQLLTKLAKKVLSWDSLTRLGGFVEIFNQNVETDLSLSEMLWFAQKAVDLDPSAGVDTQTLEGRGDANYNGQSWCFELDGAKAVETVNRLINPYTRDLTLEDMDIPKADSYYFNT